MKTILGFLQALPGSFSSRSLILGFTLVWFGSTVPAQAKASELFITHASQDHEQLLRPAMDALINGFLNRKKTVYALLDTDLDSYEGDPGHLEDDAGPSLHDILATSGQVPNRFIETDYETSGQGEHAIVATKKNIVLAGGNMDRCLCMTLASILNNQAKPEPLTIHFPVDAIFQQEWPKHWNFKETIPLKKSNYVFANKTKGFSQNKFFRLISSYLFGKNKNMCPNYNPQKLKHLKRYYFEVSRKNEPIGYFGKGTIEIQLIFTTSTEILKNLDIPPPPTRKGDMIL